MESEAKYGLVGAAVVLLSLIVVVAILWLSETGVDRDAQVYTIYFREQSLDGLQNESSVTMKGIKVGNVAQLQIPPDDIEAVRVYIKLDASTPVKTDTHAVLRRNLLTGLATIDLIGSSQDAQLLIVPPPGEPYPVIPEGTTNLEAIARSLPGLFDEMSATVHRINDVFSDDNRRALASILTNLDKVTSSLAKDDGEMGSLLDNINALAVDIRSMSKSLNAAARSTDKNLDEVSSQAVETLKKVGAAADVVREEGETMSVALVRGVTVLVQEISRFVRDFSQTANTFSTTMEQYDNPRSLLRGPHPEALGPGERVKR